jgi:hypothetical protein
MFTNCNSVNKVLAVVKKIMQPADLTIGEGETLYQGKTCLLKVAQLVTKNN